MESLYSILQHAHSGLRWLVVIFLLLTIIFSLFMWIGKKPFWQTHKNYALLGLIFTHIQIVLGFVLYFISPKVIMSKEAVKDTVSRFYLVEHLTGMVIAAVIITFGYAMAKRALAEKSAKLVFWTYLIGFLLILAMIPWPFRNLGGGWF